MTQGKNLILYIDDRAVASSTSCEIDYNLDTIPVASPVSGSHQDYVAGKRGWSSSLNCFCENMSSANLLIALAEAGGKVGVRIEDKDSTMVRTGSALVTNVRISARVGSVVALSMSLKGCGELTPRKTAVEAMESETRWSDTYMYPDSTDGTTWFVAQDAAELACGELTFTEQTTLEIVAGDGVYVAMGTSTLEQDLYNMQVPTNEITSISRMFTSKTIVLLDAGTYYFAIGVPDPETETPHFYIY